MRPGQVLEQIRIQLTALHRKLTGLRLTQPIIAAPSAWDGERLVYDEELKAIDTRLRMLMHSARAITKSGPVYFGSNEDPWKTKQRRRSFDDHSASVEEVLKACFVIIAELYSPTRAQSVASAPQLGEAVQKFIEMVRSEGPAEAAAGLPPAPSPEASIPSMLGVLLAGLLLLRRTTRH